MLTDTFRRRHNYLRVSITDKCNLRCAYCMPPQGVEWLAHDQILRNEEFIRLIRVFVSMGIDKIRFTGGEPLIRKGFLDIVEGVKNEHPDLDLCLTTNGILLAPFLGDLKRLGLEKINISLDTLSRGRFEKITRRDNLTDVLTSINRALEYDFFNIKINIVLFEETLEEIKDFLDYFSGKKVVLRFIERMPFTSEKGESFLASDKLLEVLSRVGTLTRHDVMDTSVAMMYDLLYKNKYSIKLGVIPPMTHKFCSSCNRLRLTSNGFLKTCLYADRDFDLMTPLRMGIRDEEIRTIILEGLSAKNPCHSLDCRSDDGGCHAVTTSVMSRIGG